LELSHEWHTRIALYRRPSECFWMHHSLDDRFRRKPASIGVDWRGGLPASRTPDGARDFAANGPRGAGGLQRTQADGAIMRYGPAFLSSLAKLALFMGRAGIAGSCGLFSRTRMTCAFRFLGRAWIAGSLLCRAAGVLSFGRAWSTCRACCRNGGSQSQRKGN
jgi:hypothetical protein